MKYDIAIVGGTVVEGTRLPRFRADIGIKHGRIAKIGRISRSESIEVLDATGMIVAPGFVDLHTHYDAQIHWDPYCTISGWHGVTSVVLGNCGFGFAPVRPKDRKRAMLMMTRTEQIPYETIASGMPWRWETFPEWLNNLDEIPKGVNVLSYVPVSPLMVYTMGMIAAKERPATENERREMQRLLNEAMDAGACGFSIQRMGDRSIQTDYDGTPMPTDRMADEDILSLARVLSDRDEGFIQITQSTVGDTSKRADSVETRDLKFIEKLAEVSGRPVLHNSVVAVDEHPVFHRRMLEWLADCNCRGLRVFGQGSNVRTWFEFTLEDWNLYDSSEAWKYATQGTVEEKIEKFSDPVLRQDMKDQNASLVTSGVGGPISGLRVVSTPEHPELERYINRTIGEIAESEGKDPIDTMLDIAIFGRLKVLFRSAEMTSSNPELVGEIMKDQHVVPGISDGGAHTKVFTGGSYTTDLLTWLVRDTGQMTLEDAHYHLSYLPAQAAGFSDRGYLKVGAPADIVVYDLEQLKRVPEWEYEIAHDFPANEWRRVQRADGYRWTLVNGEVTFAGGRCTGATPGILLRNGAVGTGFSGQ